MTQWIILQPLEKKSQFSLVKCEKRALKGYYQQSSKTSIKVANKFFSLKSAMSKNRKLKILEPLLISLTGKKQHPKGTHTALSLRVLPPAKGSFTGTRAV